MWPQAGLPQGSFYFDNQPNVLDQMVVNKNMARATSPSRADASSVEIVRFPPMISGGTYPAPIPFGGMGKPVNEAGFSDHFPLALTIHEAD